MDGFQVMEGLKELEADGYLTARIMNICDIYDPLRSKRPLNKPALDSKPVSQLLHVNKVP